MRKAYTRVVYFRYERACGLLSFTRSTVIRDTIRASEKPFQISKLHVANAVRSSHSSTMSDRSSLNATQISSIGGGFGSTLNSCSACSSALAFFWPTLAGSFIFCDLSDTPVPRRSVNLMPALSTALTTESTLELFVLFFVRRVLVAMCLVLMMMLLLFLLMVFCLLLVSLRDKFLQILRLSLAFLLSCLNLFQFVQQLLFLLDLLRCAIKQLLQLLLTAPLVLRIEYVHFLLNGPMTVVAIAHLVQYAHYLVVALLEILHRLDAIVSTFPTVTHNDESYVESFGQIEQMIGLLFSPFGCLQVRIILVQRKFSLFQFLLNRFFLFHQLIGRLILLILFAFLIFFLLLFLMLNLLRLLFGCIIHGGSSASLSAASGSVGSSSSSEESTPFSSAGFFVFRIQNSIVWTECYLALQMLFFALQPFNFTKEQTTVMFTELAIVHRYCHAIVRPDQHF
uniref:Uncharacterized protein n=1 Tax=Anopheles culicifacies TaxID=139723 RepID=A0A182M4H3_9DIPT